MQGIQKVHACAKKMCANSLSVENEEKRRAIKIVFTVNSKIILRLKIDKI